MKTITVFDKPMCCATGVCGPTVDPVLARFADDLRWLSTQGVPVVRYNPAQDAASFLREPLILAAMREGGESVLPVVAAGGEEKSRQRYPSREELAGWAGLPASASPENQNPDCCCGGHRCS